MTTIDTAPTPEASGDLFSDPFLAPAEGDDETDTTATLPPLHYIMGWLDHYRPVGADAVQVARWLRGLVLEAGHLRQTMVEMAAVPQRSTRDELTPTELRVFRYLRNTLMTQPDIARQMYVSINTIKTHAKHIYRKVGVTHRAQLRNVESM